MKKEYEPYLCDLHTHTLRSDGNDSYEEIIDLAASYKMEVIAITDHDVIPQEVMTAQSNGGETVSVIEYGRRKGVHVLLGIEISCDTQVDDVHIVGLGCDFSSEKFSEFSAFMARSKREAYRKLTEVLCKNGIQVSWEMVLENNGHPLGENQVQRKHIFEAMARAGYTKDWSEAKLLVRDTPMFHVKREKIAAVDAIQMIHEAGGIAILAHPYLIDEEVELNGRPVSRSVYIDHLIENGLDGIEAAYTYNKTTYKGTMTPQAIEEDIRRTYGHRVKVISGGSDYHDDAKKGMAPEKARQLGEKGVSISYFQGNPWLYTLLDHDLTLSEEDKRMLNGDFGEAKKLAMEKTVKYAKVLGAKELCSVTKSTSCYDSMEGFLLPGPDLDTIYSEAYLGKKLTFDTLVADTCLCQDDVCACDAYQWEICNQTKEFFDETKRFLDRSSELGVVRASTCAPYLTGWIPLMGEYFVSTESSNVLFCNSIWGARGNGGGQGTTFLATLTGRTPKWGLHLTENRHGTHVFHIRCRTKTRQDWDMLGYVIGQRLSPNAVPVLADGFERPDLIKIKTFFTTLATTSSAELCLIVGLSPEARSLDDAMKGNEPQAVFEITQDMIDECQKRLCEQTAGPVDFVQIGCPHCTIEELKQIADYMRGKKVKDGVQFFIYTAIPILKMAEDSGIARTILDSGAHLMTSGCVNTTEHLTGKATAMALSSGKLTHYQKTELDIPIYYGTDRQCMDAAVNGYWKGEEE